MKYNERRIAVIRESIVKVARILSGKGLRVTQSGTNAFVEYHKTTLEPIRVNIPYLPDDASENLIRAIEGFLDHEIGHLLFTDSRVVKEAFYKKVAALHNIVEDVFVEKMMKRKFTGSASNLSNMYDIFTNKFIEPKLTVMLTDPASTERDYWSILVACAIRALSGQDHFVKYMNDKWILIPSIHKALLDFETPLKRTKDSASNLKLALEIKRAVYGEKMPEEIKPPEPESKPLEDFEDSEAPEDSLEDPEALEDLEDSLEDPEALEDLEDSLEDSEASEDSLEDSETPEDSLEDSETPEDSLEDTSPTEDLDGLEGDDTGMRDERSSEDEEAGEEVDEDSDEEGVHSGGAPELGEEEESELRDTPLTASEESDLDSFDDFDDAMSDLISEMSSLDSRSSSYMPFTKEWDVIDKFVVPASFEEFWIKQIEDKVVGMTGTLQKGLERAFKAANKARWENGKKRGRINNSALTRLLSNDARVFRTREEIKTKEVAVTLLIDCSGSMGGSRIHTAVEAAWALSETLNKLGINFEVLGFTTKHHSSCVKNGSFMNEMIAEGGTFDRLEPIYIPIFKSFQERFGIEAKKRMSSITKKNFLMNNVDGESVQYAADRLKRQKETGKTLIVLSDGQPAANGNSARFRTHLKEVVKKIEKEGINVVGIGVQTNAVRDYYSKNVVINRVEDLPTTVMHQLRDAIMQKA